jgi:hypothetical protein
MPNLENSFLRGSAWLRPSGSPRDIFFWGGGPLVVCNGIKVLYAENVLFGKRKERTPIQFLKIHISEIWGSNFCMNKENFNF